MWLLRVILSDLRGEKKEGKKKAWNLTVRSSIFFTLNWMYRSLLNTIILLWAVGTCVLASLVCHLFMGVSWTLVRLFTRACFYSADLKLVPSNWYYKSSLFQMSDRFFELLACLLCFLGRGKKILRHFHFLSKGTLHVFSTWQNHARWFGYQTHQGGWVIKPTKPFWISTESQKCWVPFLNTPCSALGLFGVTSFTAGGTGITEQTHSRCGIL